MTLNLEFDSNIYSDYTILTPSQLSSCGNPNNPDFLVQFRVYFSHDSTSMHLYTSKTVILRSDSIITDLNHYAIPLFGSLGILEEHQHNLVSEISSFADELASDNSNAGHETMFPIVVSIVFYQARRKEEAAALIKELGKVAVKEEDYTEECPICLDKPSIGEEITYMPCSHFCHSHCLLMWFQKNSSCPFCRFHC
uniref:RING-type E3 ubiquitin transferase n=2 Tax=Nicotiana TaxID=4085 RepID=A0A1S3Z6U8_TOBAC|nr:PREDICTED: RING finger protein 165-like [Nicotiana sylvestris]XP_016460079.1 PREDICTED: RING finger protein 165-like [Nicotiana tabacum]